MVLRAIWLGPDPDAVDGLYENEAEALRRLTGALTGHREGFLAPAPISPVPGALSVSLPAYDALVLADGGVGERGTYFATESTTVTVPCVPKTTGSRIDALVQCVRDNQYGAQPAAHPSVGPDLFFVAGTVVGTSPTPPTDAQVAADVGPGGWFRVGNVRIDPANTEVQPGNIDDFEVSAVADVAYARIYQPGTQNINNAVLEPVVFNTIDTSNRAGFAPGAAGLNIPEAGYYDIKCRKSWHPGVNTGLRYLHIRVDGVVAATDVFRAFAGSGTQDANMVSYSAYFDGGEVIDAGAFQDSGAFLGSDDAIDDYLEIRQRRD